MGREGLIILSYHYYLVFRQSLVPSSTTQQVQQTGHNDTGRGIVAIA